MSDSAQRPPAGQEPGSAGPAPAGMDAARRRFFREFSRELVSTAATVINAAGALQRTSAEAAAAILDPATGAALLAGALPPEPRPGPPSGFRSAFRWEGDRLFVVDQRRLPGELVEFEIRSASDAAYAIRDMIVRGAPAIGQVAAIGLALTADRLRASGPLARRAAIRGAAGGLASTRPTAVNLRWAVDRMLARFEAVGEDEQDGAVVASALWAEAEAIVLRSAEDNGRLASFGAGILPPVEGRPLELLTHCNTGPLAGGQFGTALGVVQVAHAAGRPLHVWVDETRPYLQGSRLTAWELAQAGVPHTLIADSAAGSLMAAGKVDAVLVGADRVAANGDTANKVGTYPLAVLAARHGIPFLVCAPISSIDLAAPDGSAIPIEERSPDEISKFRGTPVAPEGTEAWNPAFDVTPAELITAIVTDEGALRPPFGPAIAAAAERAILRGTPIPVGGRGPTAADDPTASDPGPTADRAGPSAADAGPPAEEAAAASETGPSGDDVTPPARAGD